ncbi:MAG: SRPBCC family protein [Bryobacter sp.]|jgi:hypothetical protein|nr:SRPBCC family protein [Bryobacter sp. CoA8 C33]
MQPISRGSFLILGVLLAGFKILLDFFLLKSFRIPWSPGLYYSPLPFDLLHLTPDSYPVLLSLAALALPFSLAGIWLCLRRLETLSLPPWLVILFFFPSINLVFFWYLLLAPAQKSVFFSFLKRPESYSSAWAAAMISAAVGLAAIGLCVWGFRSYGWGVFFAVPFAIGLISALLVSSKSLRSFRYCFSVSCLAMAMVGIVMISFALEGLLCLLMSIPLALPLAMAGVVVGRAIATPSPSVRPNAFVVAISLLATCPLTATIDTWAGLPNRLHRVVTSVEIAAPPEIVWRHVISFRDLPAPTEWFFAAGIAYPLRARIEGTGPGAIRYCEFSTGPFVEPVTAWQPNELLAFDVTASPPPMRELSPYDIHPPHLDSFLTSRRGQFRLLRLPHGGTLLEGSTWYELRLLPEAFWSFYADFFIHSIHHRVLHHIAHLSEQRSAPVRLN